MNFASVGARAAAVKLICRSACSRRGRTQPRCLSVGVVLYVVHVQTTLEGHVVVLDDSRPRGSQYRPVTQFSASLKRLAVQLELLRYLPLVLVVGDFLQGFRRPVEVGADLQLIWR